MYVPENPPPPPGGSPFGFFQPRRNAGETLDEVRFDHLQHSGYRSQNRYPFALKRLCQISGAQARIIINHGSQQGWNPDPHELAEYVTEGQRVQDPQRMNEALISEILLHLAFDGSQ